VTVPVSCVPPEAESVDLDNVGHLAWPSYSAADILRDGGTLTARCGHERTYAPGEWSPPLWTVVCRCCVESLLAELRTMSVTL
jgi:hypothetical protein